MLADIRQAFRGLIKTPSFTLVAVSVLADRYWSEHGGVHAPQYTSVKAAALPERRSARFRGQKIHGGIREFGIDSEVQRLEKGE